MSCNICGSKEHEATTAGCPRLATQTHIASLTDAAVARVIAAAVAAEREACARLAELEKTALAGDMLERAGVADMDSAKITGRFIAAAIRARGSVET